MIKKVLLIKIIILFFIVQSFAQDNQQTKDLKFRRSSLSKILIESESFPMKDTVIKAYKSAPFPELYNDHSFEHPLFNPSDIKITNEDRKAYGHKEVDTTKKDKSSLMSIIKDPSNMTNRIIDKNFEDMPILIDKYIKSNKIANKIVAKWFNRQDDGSFSMDLVNERGLYDASYKDVNIAKRANNGTELLKAAGQDLIPNTFIVFSRMKFVNNEVIASQLRDKLKTLASYELSSYQLILANAAINILYNKAKIGYSVWTTSYLYKLKWNDTVADKFGRDYYMEKSSIDASKKEAFDNSDYFQLEYVGSQNSTSVVTFSLKESRTNEQIVKLSTIRNLDHVFAKLQKEYDQFKPKVQLLTADPITAKIGMKEGLEGGEKFEVLEQVIDPKTGLTEYKRKGIIKVEKGMVWDNRFNLSDAITESKSPNGIDRTTFKGGKDFYTNMLIREIK